jgi:hypothetical protein
MAEFGRGNLDRSSPRGRGGPGDRGTADARECRDRTVILAFCNFSVAECILICGRDGSFVAPDLNVFSHHSFCARDFIFR